MKRAFIILLWSTEVGSTACSPLSSLRQDVPLTSEPEGRVAVHKVLELTEGTTHESTLHPGLSNNGTIAPCWRHGTLELCGREALPSLQGWLAAKMLPANVAA